MRNCTCVYVDTRTHKRVSACILVSTLYANANAFVAWIHLLSLLAILAIILNDHPACHC